jgi:hypothetical protein
MGPIQSVSPNAGAGLQPQASNDFQRDLAMTKAFLAQNRAEARQDFYLKKNDETKQRLNQR